MITKASIDQAKQAREAFATAKATIGLPIDLPEPDPQPPPPPPVDNPSIQLHPDWMIRMRELSTKTTFTQAERDELLVYVALSLLRLQG